MGAEPYNYTVPYENDIQNALKKLGAKVFERGNFNGAELGPATPEEALEMAEEDGTGSILDITQVTDEPDFCCAAPFRALNCNGTSVLKNQHGQTSKNRTNSGRTSNAGIAVI